MSDHREANPRTNKLLRALDHNFLLHGFLLFLCINLSLTASSPALTYQCAKSCECNQTINSARCEDVNELIASYQDDERLHVFMPIKSLDLSNNQLDKISNQLPDGIEELNLSHNKLTQVQKLNFKNLQKLNLSNNRITSAKLKKIPRTVVELNLAYNEITYLPTEFMKLKQLRRLEMKGNPLNCTCDTLHVRNWLTTKNVWTDRIVCSSPINVKGQAWLQVRQNDICFETSTTTQGTTFKSKYNWDEYEDGNNIMGDQPPEDRGEDAEDAADKDYDEEEEKDASNPPEEEEEKDVFDEEASGEPDTVGDKKSADEDHLIPVTPEDDYENDSASPKSDVEGSGDDPAPSSPEPEDDDGSGSGYGPLDMGIFKDESSSVEPLMAKIDIDPSGQPTPNQQSDTNRASTQDNKGTYILLGILAICLIALMVFVMMKNKKEKSRNRRYDVEKNGTGTELQDMDKRLLGKPMEQNGSSNGNGKAEHIPLMNGNNPSNDKTYLDAPHVDVPKLNGNGKVPAESLHEIPAKADEAVDAPRKPVSSDSEDDSFHPANNGSLNVSPEPPKRYSPVYTSRSPPNERYSPVYSPETGRGKQF